MQLSDNHRGQQWPHLFEEKLAMEMNWVSVKDELPKLGEPVLLCDWTGVVQRQTFYRDYDDVSDFWQDVGDNYDGVPLNVGDHWMPLPTPANSAG